MQISDTESNFPRIPLPRFTMRGMLFVMALWALALFIWRAFVYEPPTHKIPLYEKAPSTQRLTTRIGPNQVRISLIARNMRDSSLSVEDGNGTELAHSKVTKPQVLKRAASWLDIAQIEFEPGPNLLDIIEVRIFDHETRALLTDNNPRFGWQVIKPNLLQLYGFGEELPSKVDVWLRFHSYDKKDEVTQLKPHVNATCELPGGKIQLAEIQSGSWAYHSGKSPSLYKKLDGSINQFSTVLTWTGKWQENKYQITAVTRNGDKSHLDYPHFLRFGPAYGMKESIGFRIPQDEIDHFELRPFGGRHRFFFEAVQLPKTSGKPFSAAPVATVPIAGEESTIDISEFAPLSAQLTTHRGDWANGSQSTGTWVSITPRLTGPINLENEFTVIYYMGGLGRVNWQLRFKETTNGKMKSESEFSSRGGGASWGSSVLAGHKCFQKPLDQVEAIEVKLQPSP